MIRRCKHCRAELLAADKEYCGACVLEYDPGDSLPLGDFNLGEMPEN